MIFTVKDVLSTLVSAAGVIGFSVSLHGCAAGLPRPCNQVAKETAKLDTQLKLLEAGCYDPDTDSFREDVPKCAALLAEGDAAIDKACK